MQDRINGYESALVSLGLRSAVEPVKRLEPQALTPERLRAWLDQGVTALLIENDILARQLLTSAAALGCSCPEDFSFAVLGDPLEPTDQPPKWTSFRIPRQEMGRQSLDVLLELLQDPSGVPVQRTLPCTFVPGTSTGMSMRRRGGIS